MPKLSSYKFLFLFFFFSFLGFNALSQTKKSNLKKKYYKYCGQVFLKRENFEPSPDRPIEAKGVPFKTTVFVHRLLDNGLINENQSSSKIIFKNKIKPLASFETDEQGNFCTWLAKGKYSLVFLDKNSDFSAISFEIINAKSMICPVEVKTKNSESKDFIIYDTPFYMNQNVKIEEK